MDIETKEARLNIRIWQTLRSRVDAAAKSEGLTTAGFVTRVLKQYLDQHHPQGETGTMVKAESKDGKADDQQALW